MLVISRRAEEGADVFLTFAGLAALVVKRLLGWPKFAARQRDDLAETPVVQVAETLLSLLTEQPEFKDRDPRSITVAELCRFLHTMHEPCELNSEDAAHPNLGKRPARFFSGRLVVVEIRRDQKVRLGFEIEPEVAIVRDDATNMEGRQRFSGPGSCEPSRGGQPQEGTAA